jgi:hypothetical protein
MKWSNGYRMKWMLCGVVTVIMLLVANTRGEYFQDDFNRSDGEVGNGWEIYKGGNLDIKIEDNEVLIAGQQRGDWNRSGIYRSVEGETRFSFDFKADDNLAVHIELSDFENNGWIDFYAEPGGSISCGYSSNRISIGPGITGQYHNLVVEKEGAKFTLTLNGQVIGTVTNEQFPPIDDVIHIDEVFIGADAADGTVGSLHIDNVMIGQPPIIPIVDFNGDGIVDADDMCIMVDYWGTDEPLCDICPMPWGDGIVDVQDLIVLAEHLFEEVNDPTLIAHWPLDEAEGMFAADSVGDNDAVVLGGIEWQSDGGQINGALELDGVSGYGIAGAVLNPADGPFSVLAWINGGAPGQVVVSQQLASNWLSIDTEGNMMTELKSSDPLAEPLLSETAITDGQWHRIGLVWDGSHRTLYVDGVVVAEDTQDGLDSSENGLNIGSGKMTQPGTYFSGLIDDVRIYKRAVHP